jgi:hypothetical protein
MNATMPRPASENTFQITFKVPEEWIAKADALAASMSRPGLTLTRTDALRQALAKGIEVLQAEAKKAGRK